MKSPEVCDGCGLDLSVRPVVRTMLTHTRVGVQQIRKRVRMRPAQVVVACRVEGSLDLTPEFAAKVDRWAMRLCVACVERLGVAAAIAVVLDKRQGEGR